MIHPTAEVAKDVVLGEGTRVWHQAQIRERVRIGKHCIIGKGVYIDSGVPIGDNVKIQNYSLVYHGVSIEDGVFVGPRVTFTNDKLPRAINPDGSLKSDADWVVSETRVKYGAALGAGSIIVCGTTIGRFALIGAGAVVTKDVPDHGLAVGNPARLVGYVCKSAHPMKNIGGTRWHCDQCDEAFDFPEMIK